MGQRPALLGSLQGWWEPRGGREGLELCPDGLASEEAGRQQALGEGRTPWGVCACSASECLKGLCLQILRRCCNSVGLSDSPLLLNTISKVSWSRVELYAVHSRWFYSLSCISASFGSWALASSIVFPYFSRSCPCPRTLEDPGFCGWK